MWQIQRKNDPVSSTSSKRKSTEEGRKTGESWDI